MATYRLACIEQPCLEMAARLDEIVHRYESRHGVRVTFESPPVDCGDAIPFALIVHDERNGLSAGDLEGLRLAVTLLGIKCYGVMDFRSNARGITIG